MPAKKIYLVRHGQTRFNKLGVVQGRGIDASLDDTGRDQAKLFYEEYKSVPFQKIYISSMKRTYESIHKFIDDGIPYEIHEGLDEISWGDHEGAEASEERNIYFRETVNAWHSGETDLKIEGGESPEDVAARQQPVLEKILSAPEDLVLICMHGRAMRVILCILLDIPIHQMDQFEHANLGLYVLEVSDKGTEIKYHNSTEHFVN